MHVPHADALVFFGATGDLASKKIFPALQVELPILEYRPFRSCALDQSSRLLMQCYAGFDTPLQSSVVAPEGATTPGLRTIGFGGIRVVFDWRYSL
jgi:hypothetical protein